MARNFPAAGLYFGTFEFLKATLAARAGLEKPNSMHLLLSGGVAGFAYWSCFYPLDVIKSAMQAIFSHFFLSGVLFSSSIS